MQTSYKVLFRLNVLTFFLLNAFPSVFLFLASLGTCSHRNTKHLEGASPSLAKSLWRCDASSPGRRICISPFWEEAQFCFQCPLNMHLQTAILDGRWNGESFIDYLNQTSLLSGPLSFLGEKVNARGSLCKVGDMSARLSLHREGKMTKHSHLRPLVSLQQTKFKGRVFLSVSGKYLRKWEI